MAQTKVRSSTQLNIDSDLNLVSHKIINLAAGTNPNDAVTKSQLDNAVAGLSAGLKAPVQSVNDLKAITVGASDDKWMCLVEDVGLYRYDHQSTLTPDDEDVVKPNNVTLPNPGRWVKINSNINAHNNLSNIQGGTVTERYHLSLGAYTIANQPATSNQAGYLTAADWSIFNNKLDSSKYVCREVPSGTVNGSNTNFALASIPISGTEMVFVNGILQNAGSGNDYTISGNTITFAQAPKTGDVILVTYWRS
ncbi:MAG TPA: hypothetical protein PLU67_02630 [Candidatus Kapabacteria bacterium]|nr:hypothetical protein [Candidatus Kapabacteria bacterium]